EDRKTVLLTVRDSTSYDRISSMNIDINYHKTNDLGVLISKACEPNIINCVRQSYNEDIIGFSLCNFERHSNGDTNKEVARNNYVCNLIKEILANNVSQKILLLCFNSNKDVGDRALCQNLISQMPEYKDRLLYYEYDGNLNNMAMTIKKMRCLIGMRLHSIVFAYSLNVPLLMLPYHEKCIEFSKMINLSANQIINYESQSIQSILSILCEKLPTLDNNKSMAEATLNYLYLREVLL
ncbi:MAG: polysaccharide pyruvyl transferase family protein, partial [Geobacteraceae bacterium]|nr:polysaccharide pyruvyl transferase family protein [Geobacteraceae bacterium]